MTITSKNQEHLGIQDIMDTTDKRSLEDYRYSAYLDNLETLDIYTHEDLETLETMDIYTHEDLENPCTPDIKSVRTSTTQDQRRNQGNISTRNGETQEFDMNQETFEHQKNQDAIELQKNQETLDTQRRKRLHETETFIETRKYKARISMTLVMTRDS
jgi:hypothetical protein